MPHTVKQHSYRLAECGKVAELREYSRPQYRFSGVKRINANGKNVSGIIRPDSIKRSKQRIFFIAQGNINPNHKPYFLTLTYAKKSEHTENLELCRHDLKNFFRRFSNHAFGNQWKLQYLAVAERQMKNKRNVIHFHIIIFNLPTLFWNERKTRYIAKIWGFGFADLRTLEKTVKGKTKIKNIPAYIASYLGKDNCVQFGKNFFYASRNLARPHTDFSPLPFHINGDIVKETKIISKKGIINIKIYDRV